MKKILTVVGARPQFIKCAPVSQSLRRDFKEILVHTGQHYDAKMSQSFFEELAIPEPDYNLKIGSGTHGEQTGRMLIELEKVVLHEKPDGLLVYGDTNSTLAGALVASKLGIPLAHVEAGLRSRNKTMPEELNRICTDHVSNFLLCPTETAVVNLAAEGITDNVFNVGDVMFDATLQYADKFEKNGNGNGNDSRTAVPYYFFTLHRQENTDNIERFRAIVSMVGSVRYRVIFPIHPRTKKVIADHGIVLPGNILPIEPVGYLESLHLQKKAKMVITDSGGIQKEAFFLKVPCITVRDETEWVETVTDGFNAVVGVDHAKFRSAEARYLEAGPQRQGTYFGNGRAAEKIASVLRSSL